MPVYAGFDVGGKIVILDLYRPASKRRLAAVKTDIAKAKKIFDWIDNNNHTLITSNYKDLCVAYDLPIDNNRRDIYDLNLDRKGAVKHTDNDAKDKALIHKILERMRSTELKLFHKLIADAAIVYQDLENKGILINGRMCHPCWSMKTYSGRSSTSGFNLQGYTSPEHVGSTSSNEGYLLLHFDWMAADVRVASILANDEVLQSTYKDTDPYDYMLHNSNNFSSRDQCKLFLLKSINSLNISKELQDIYPKLSAWLERCSIVTRTPNGHLDTLLGKRFRVETAKNGLAVLNGVMQGSIAHGMHNVIRKVWDKYSTYLVAEIHDSIVLSVPRDPKVIKSVIKDVVDIMTRPFSGFIDDDPFFSVRVSLGSRWKNWDLIQIIRESGVVNVKKQR